MNVQLLNTQSKSRCSQYKQGELQDNSQTSKKQLELIIDNEIIYKQNQQSAGGAVAVDIADSYHEENIQQQENQRQESKWNITKSDFSSVSAKEENVKWQDAPFDKNQNLSKEYQKRQYFSIDLAEILRNKQIPLQYVRGLLLMNNLKEIKSVRRLKVQRYLQKKKNKTWIRKVYYNCRQKVAQERLRIKGRFIKKRQAMQILGIKNLCTLKELKKGLEKLFQNKNIEEIDLIIKEQNRLQKLLDLSHQPANQIENMRIMI